jgi:hypothetical protein
MSTPIWLKTGVAARDGIVVQTAAGAFTTGLVDANFSKKLTKDGVGNQALTGITVTEADAANNAGQYSVALATNSFITVAGSYHLLIYRTASPTDSWEQVFNVTQTGDVGSVGTLSFTATAANGRVTDSGSNPLAGATVYLQKASTNFLIATTTDASGLWGPIFFDASYGTVNITAIKSAYSQATSTLTVGASSITGPGSDLALTAVSTGSTVTAAELWAYARRMAMNKTGTQADLKLKQACNDALDRLAKEKDWNWYTRRGWIATSVPYSTGTITLTQEATTCVLAGGSFPTWAGEGRLYLTGYPLIDIATRNSTTSLTLASNWGAATGSYSYILIRDAYSLPSNSFEFKGILEGQRWPYSPEPVSIEQLWTIQNDLMQGQRNAWNYAIAYNKMWLWPYPTEALNVAYIYRARPAPLTTDSDIADVDVSWLETLHHCINVYIAVYFGECVAGSAEQCLSMYMDSLSRQISNDKSPKGIGNARNKINPAILWTKRR